MNIAIYVAELDIKGGTHKQVLRLAQYLVRQGHSVRIITPTYTPTATYPEFTQLNVVSLYSNPPKSRFDRFQRRFAPVRLALRLSSMDVVNIHDNRGLLFFFTAWLLRRGRSYFWQINDLHWSFRLANNSNVLPRWHHPIARTFNRMMARLMDRITVNVGKNVARVQEQLGVKAELLYCGVDLPAEGKDTPPPQSPPFRILSTGVFFRYRNYERLIEAAAKAAQRTGQAVALTIIGSTRHSPEYAEEVQLLANTLGIDLAIKQNLSDDELNHEIENCHVFAFVNIDQSWGLSVFEAAARGRAVILSNSVGAAELLSGLPGYLLVDPHSVIQITQALVSLLQDPKKCVTLGTDAAQTVRNMAWDTMYCSKIEAMFASSLSASA